MMTTKTASNAVFSVRERLLLNRTITKVVTKMMNPRIDTCRNVKSFGWVPKPSSASANCDSVFIAKDCIADGNFYARMGVGESGTIDRKSTRLNSSHGYISY